MVEMVNLGTFWNLSGFATMNLFYNKIRAREH
jgi:hypothetical protein